MVIENWVTLRTKLSNKQTLTDEWEKTILIFQKRISERYFNPLNFIIEREGKSKGDGFLILTLQCSIIEFLATIEDGMIFNYEANKKKNYYYSKSAKWYNKFLNSSQIFEGYFHGEGSFLRSDDFYLNVRCALIHETQTRKNWTVNIYNKSKSDDSNNKTIFEGKKIYRTALNVALENYFNEYCLKAKENNKIGMKYRRFIGRKLDVIHEIDPDNCFWW